MAKGTRDDRPTDKRKPVVTVTVTTRPATKQSSRTPPPPSHTGTHAGVVLPAAAGGERAPARTEFWLPLIAILSAPRLPRGRNGDGTARPLLQRQSTAEVGVELAVNSRCGPAGAVSVRRPGQTSGSISQSMSW